MILRSKYLVPKGYEAIALFPVILIRYDHLRGNRKLINHESIHLRQQLELLVFPFYVIYVLEFLVRLVALGNWKSAYYKMSFEREAYQNESNFQFLKNRPFWNFIQYF